MLGLYTRSVNASALLIGWAAGMGLGTYMAAIQGFTSSIYPLGVLGVTIPGYAALYSVLVNFLLTAALTPVFGFMSRRSAASAAR